MQLKDNGSLGNFLAAELQRARVHVVLVGDTLRARAIADAAFRVAPWERITRFDRPYAAMLLYLASIRDENAGRALVSEWSRGTTAEWKMRDSLGVLIGRGEVALSAGHASEAVKLFRAADVSGCEPCFYPRYARAFDVSGQRDSARLYYERYAAAHLPNLPLSEGEELANTYLRLGVLFEERRDAKAAIGWYEKFTTLWAKADTPVLRAKVREVQGRLERLRKQRA